MIIGINANEANVEHRVGIGQYAFELLAQLSRFRVSDFGFRIYLETLPMADLPDDSDTWKYNVLGPGKLWTLTKLQNQLLKEKFSKNTPDVLLSLTHYTPTVVPTKSVITIMDLAFEKFPQFFKKRDLYQLRYWTRFSARQAQKIITISQSSKKDICEIYNISPNKVVVTYPGYNTQRFNSKVRPSKKYGDYILYLGTLQPRKNLERLIEAYRLLKTDIKLVVVGMINEGRGGWMNERIKGDKNIILTGYLPDDQIPGLYAGAKAYVLPSLYEGFGIPPIEAMACGTPVCVSRVSSLPEICGQAATYIEDPYSVESIKSALEDVLANGQKKVKLGFEQVKRYNWETTAKQTLEVLKNV